MPSVFSTIKQDSLGCRTKFGIMRGRRLMEINHPYVLVSQPSRAVFEDEQPATGSSDSALHVEENDR